MQFLPRNDLRDLRDLRETIQVFHKGNILNLATMNRRESFKALGLVAGATALPSLSFSQQKKSPGQFKICLNTSTIRGQKLGLTKMIETAAKGGFDSLELWVMDVKEYKDGGGSMSALKKLIDDSHLTVEDAIGFAPWMVDDDAQRAKGCAQMKE